MPDDAKTGDAKTFEQPPNTVAYFLRGSVTYNPQNAIDNELVQHIDTLLRNNTTSKLFVDRLTISVNALYSHLDFNGWLWLTAAEKLRLEWYIEKLADRQDAAVRLDCRVDGAAGVLWFGNPAKVAEAATALMRRRVAEVMKEMPSAVHGLTALRRSIEWLAHNQEV